MAHSAITQARLDQIRNRDDAMLQDEIIGAKQIQQQTNCTWTEALKASSRILRSRENY